MLSISPVTTILLRALLGLAVAAASGCAEEDGALYGSIDGAYPLAHDAVRIRKQEEFLEVSFLRRTEVGFEAALKLAAEVEDLPAGPVTIRGDGFLERVSLRRTMLEGPTRFPQVASGVLQLDDFRFEDGAPIAGSFDVAFVDGHTLHGEFSGELVEVILPARPAS